MSNKNHRLADNSLLLESAGTFPFTVFCFPAIASTFLFFLRWPLSLHSTVPLVSCWGCVVSFVAMPLLQACGSFLLLSPSLSKEDQQPCHNNRQHSLKQRVMKSREAACLLWCFGLEKAPVCGLLMNLFPVFVWKHTWNDWMADCFPDQHVEIAG